MSSVRTRFAPSPTGVLHLGSIRTALYCWLFARRYGGKSVLRIEDTDRLRSSEEYVQAIIEGLQWLGLTFDEGPFFQSKRMPRYKEVVDALLECGKAYRCYCTKEELQALREQQKSRGKHVRYDGRCRDRMEARDGVDPVVRFKNPQSGIVVVDDQVRGRVVFNNTQLDDLVIVRSDGSPTYNFSVVVDDYDMRITHVIRGDDHLNNTPRQMNLFAALDAEAPVYAHLPMILGSDGSKLSKRHGAVDIRDYQSQGFLPEAVLNYLIRLGWSYGDQEIFSIEEMVDLFDFSGVNQSASSFSPKKLVWVNQQHIIAASSERLGGLLLPFIEAAGLDPANGPPVDDVAEVFRERAETLVHMASNARFCYEDFEEIEATAAKKHLRPVILDPLKKTKDELAMLRNWDRKGISSIIDRVAANFGINLGKLGQPLRVAVTGGSVSPPIDATIWLVGRDRTVERLNRAIELIEMRVANIS